MHSIVILSIDHPIFIPAFLLALIARQRSVYRILVLVITFLAQISPFLTRWLNPIQNVLLFGCFFSEILGTLVLRSPLFLQRDVLCRFVDHFVQWFLKIFLRVEASRIILQKVYCVFYCRKIILGLVLAVFSWI